TILGSLLILLQLAEFDSLAVESSQQEVGHFVADLEAALRCGLFAVTRVLVVLALTRLIVGVRSVALALVTAALMVVVFSVFFLVMACRHRFGVAGMLLGVLRFLLMRVGFCGRSMLFLRAAVHRPSRDSGQERQDKHTGTNSHRPTP